MSASAVADAPMQADLSLLESQGWEAHVLNLIPWRRPLDQHGQPIGQYPGVAELATSRHLACTALLNDLANFGVVADVRLDPDAFAELRADPTRPTRGLRDVKDAQGVVIGFEVMGPGPQEWRPNNSRAAGYRPGTHWWKFTTEGWTEVPAFVAHWFWFRQFGEDERLGAGYFRTKARDERDPDESRNAAVWVAGVRARMQVRYEAGEDVPEPRDLFVVRMACEREQGYRPSGLIDPTANAARDAEIAQLRAQLEAALQSQQKPARRGQEG